MGCTTLNAENGKACFDGNIRGVTFLKTKYKGSKTDLGLKSTWDVLAVAGASTLLSSPDNEILPSEIIETTLKFESAIATGKKKGGITLKFVDNIYTRTLLDGLGVETEVLLHTDKGLVMGLQTSEANQRTSMLVSLSPIDSVNGDLGMIDVKMSFKEDFTRLGIATELEDGFTSAEIATWKGVQFAEIASTATSLQFAVQDIGELALDAIDPANITLYNSTDKVFVTPTTATLTGNVVDLTFASLAGKTVKVGYATPTLVTDLFYVQKTFSTAL